MTSAAAPPRAGRNRIRAGLDVGGKIPGSIVGDRGDDRRTGESQRRAQSAVPSGQHLVGRGDGPFGQRRRRRSGSVRVGTAILAGRMQQLHESVASVTV